jgi:hypothetical protein
MADSRAEFAERLVTCCTIAGCLTVTIVSAVAACVALEWALNCVVRTFRLYDAFVVFLWERMKKALETKNG